MKIAWISSWPPRHCGIATYSYDLVTAIRRKGHQVEVVCHTDGGNPGEKNVHPVIDSEVPAWEDKLLRTVNLQKPDVVHIQHEYGLYRQGKDFACGLFKPLFRWKREKKFPTVVTLHSIYSKLSPSVATYVKVVQDLADAMVVHLSSQYTHLPQNLGRMVPNAYVIPHGARLHRPYSKAKFKQKLGFTENQKIIGLVGWFDPNKGFEQLLCKWDYLVERIGPSLHLILAGEARDGSRRREKYRNTLLNLANSCKYKDQIKIILGKFSPEEYENILRSLDLMVLPYKLASQSGNLANCFSCGIPVVVSGLEGLKEEVEKSGAGIAVSPGDKEELIQSVSMLMQNEEWRKKLSQQAIQYVKNKIDWRIVAQKHIELYSELIKQKAKKSTS